MNNESKQKVICVLGMHRSGTSCLIGSLQKSGLYLGKHATWNAHNERGNRENEDIRTLNESLLDYNNGSWKNPPEKIIFSEEHLEMGREIISSYDNHHLWGFKDPRTLLTIDFWKALIDNFQFIGIFRHPFAVALSLGARGSGIGMAVDNAYAVWNYYNGVMLDEYEKTPFPILSFDWDEEYFHMKLNKLNTQLGLNGIKKEDRFFTPTLRHHADISHEIIPDESLAIYNRLQAGSF